MLVSAVASVPVFSYVLLFCSDVELGISVDKKALISKSKQTVLLNEAVSMADLKQAGPM